MKNNILILIYVLASLYSCRTSKTTTENLNLPKRLNPDSVLFSLTDHKYNLYKDYRTTERKINNLKHIKLDLNFDWQQRRVIGVANLTLAPHFYPTDSLTLDAKNFDIHKVLLINNSQRKPLKYKYDSLQIHIQLDKVYNKDEEYEILIDYTAKPYEIKKRGHSYLLDDRGLFFINPTGLERDKPQQFWTQGQTESNSYWFPLIDAPNQRCTQEIYLTVDNRFKSLSNGKLANTLLNTDTTRTDYWVLDKPHAPYLTMIAAGDFAVVKDEWRTTPLFYYVPHDYEEFAKDIFGNTKEMMTLFSFLFGVDFPWNKYSQIVVKDYISGAMENTTATVFGDFVLKTRQELIDINDETIIAHELSHQWFGNYVTCESWSNLTLNEAFATYSEYLWLEHKYGKDAADYHLQSTLSAYLNESLYNPKKLIRFYYNYRDDMFDLHSYNKGACVLHMLRKKVGDKAFFASLNYYLEKNKYRAVEIHDLRLAFEEVTGMDLSFFFNQWFFKKGHPNLNFSYTYNDKTKTLDIVTEQMQDIRKYSLFYFPLDIDIYLNNSIIRKTVDVTNQKDTFSFRLPSKPDLVNIDPDKILICAKHEDKPVEDWLFQFKNAPKYLDRYEAIKALTIYANNQKVKETIIGTLDDSFWSIRHFAIENLYFEGWKNDKAFIKKLQTLALKDPKSKVRSKAILKLSETSQENYLPIIKPIVKNDSSIVVFNAVSGLFRRLSPEQSLKLVENDIFVKKMLNTVLYVYKEHGDRSKAEFFISTFKTTEGYDKWNIIESYTDFVLRFDDVLIDEAVAFFEKIAVKGHPWWTKAVATRSIYKISEFYDQKTTVHSSDLDNNEIQKYNDKAENLKKIINEIIKNESNKTLINWYKQMF